MWNKQAQESQPIPTGFVAIAIQAVLILREKSVQF